MDIGDMIELKTKDEQARYILTIIDIFSKYAMVFVLKDKSAEEAYKAIQTAFKTMGIPRSVYTDEGAEFKGKVQELFKGEGIQHITTVAHAHVVERLIRTIKNGIHDRVRFNKAPWEDMLPYVIDKYNNTIHSSTGYKPKEAVNDKYAMEIKVKLELNARTKRRLPNISIGDKVKV
jgi:transposase InsO family protein